MEESVKENLLLEYQDLANSYNSLERWLPRKNVEDYTLRKIVKQELGSVLVGKRILDMACGDGYYTNFFMTEFTPESVDGIDLSPDMIKVAKANNKDNKIRYFVADCAGDLPCEISEPYDIIFAAFLLNYAETKDILRKFVRNIHRCLTPGGIFIGLNDNAFCQQFYHGGKELSPEEVSQQPFFQRYDHYRVMTTAKPKDGDVVVHWCCLENTGKYTNYYLDPTETVEKVFKEIGFECFKYCPTETSLDKASFWEEYLSVRPNIFMVAKK
jgi:SAM-dependent methyltransferase